MTCLWLCEKPSQARDIAGQLGANQKGDGFLRGGSNIVTWCFGHLLSMAPPEAYGVEYRRWTLESLPILPSKWLLEIPKDKRKQFRTIKNLVAEASEVIIATDADREGEMIAREVLERCRWSGPTRRLWLAALDDASIRKAMKDLRPGEQTRALYLAGIGRARADWLVGMNLTRAYTVLGRARGHDGVLSVGRVQTPTLRLVVDRDRAIESFVPSPYWEVTVEVSVSNGRFPAKWVPGRDICDPEGRCISQQAALEVAQRIAKRQGSVSQLNTQRKCDAPPLPYSLSRLQQDADRLYGLSGQQTLDAAQALYEKHKATTYPRVDCSYLPESMLAEAPPVLQAVAKADPAMAQVIAVADLSLRSRAWNDAKLTAHHAIIPTVGCVDLSRMSRSERLVYGLIRRCYVAQFYPACEYDQTKVTITVAGESFSANGKQEVSAGWKALYRSDQEETESGPAEDKQLLPAMTQGEACVIERAYVEDKQTRPPARFTEGTLLAAMENVAKLVADPDLKRILRETAGLGTVATRGPIIKTLIERGFLKKSKKSLVSSESGRVLIDALPDAVKEPGMTALWEQTLDDIAQDKRDLNDFLGRQAQWVSKLVEQAKSNKVPVVSQSALHPCPECGRPLRRRNGKNGHFWGCSGYPECSATLPDVKGRPGKLRAASRRTANHGVAGKKCPTCNKGTLVKRTSKKGREFLGCTSFPKCKHFEWVRQAAQEAGNTW